MAKNIGNVIEYRDIPAGSHAKRQVLESEVTTIGRRHREYFLSHSTAGYECAGSMARWTNEYYSVTFEAGGAINGRRFLTEKDARDLFNKWIAHDNEESEIEAQIARDEARKEEGPPRRY